MSDFYVGYLPKAPPDLARFLRKVILGLTLVALAAALGLVLAQNPFAKSTFEYGKVREFEGIVGTSPYPTLWIAQPGQTTGKGEHYLLVAPGKHGADDLLSKFDHRQVRLQGQLIYRDGGMMVEIVPGSVVAVSTLPSIPDEARDLGPVTATGEIVDSKCYLGVMNPGSGKAHRDCAARCLSGGIPPIFIADHIIADHITGPGGAVHNNQYLLVGPDGGAIGRDALRDFVAEPITLHAELLQRGGSLLLQIDPGRLHH